MPSDCFFELNKENALYFSGETIVGTITLTTASDKNVREVCIIFLGEGKVRWDESHTTNTGNGNSSTSTTHYRAHEIYVNNSTRVYDEGTLPAGRHTFTFNIPLPWECPTSFEGKFGHIRYEISLKINRYYRFDNIFKKPLTIIKTVDLNLNPAFKVPIVMEDFTSTCCWPCSKGTIFCTLKIPFIAYAPGQPVKYTLEIANQSMDDVDGYNVQFMQKVTFNSRTPNHKERHTTKLLVLNGFNDKCLRLSNRVLEGELIIPATPPTTERSTIICVEYFLQVSVKLPCCKRNPNFKVPLLIGTIPIRESLPLNRFSISEDQRHILPSAPVLSTPEIEALGNSMPPNYNDILPPTFEEATRSNSPFIDTDLDERTRLIGFRPLYPVYNVPYQDQN